MIAPDLPLLGGFAERGRLTPRVVPFYNATHRAWGPMALLVAAALACSPLLLVGAGAWLAHILIDRIAGYGLRTKDGWQRAA